MKPGPSPRPLAARFWAMVNLNGPIMPHMETCCWLWTGHTNNAGYGQIWVNEHGKKELAHRAAWFLATSAWPITQVNHKCDNPRCVRHDHHFSGTQAANLADMSSKGRGDGGRTNGLKTHCPKGHAYSGSNVQFYQYGKYTFRRCKACYRERYEASKARLY